MERSTKTEPIIIPLAPKLSSQLSSSSIDSGVVVRNSKRTNYDRFRSVSESTNLLTPGSGRKSQKLLSQDSGIEVISGDTNSLKRHSSSNRSSTSTNLSSSESLPTSERSSSKYSECLTESNESREITTIGEEEVADYDREPLEVVYDDDEEEEEVQDDDNGQPKKNNFPILNVNADCEIDPKIINKKDGLRDTMYYLDEFGSPKLREKYAKKKNKKSKSKTKFEDTSTTNQRDNEQNCDITTRDKKTSTLSRVGDTGREGGAGVVSCVSLMKICKKFKSILSKFVCFFVVCAIFKFVGRKQITITLAVTFTDVVI